jgi:hypothetical protein
MHACVTCHDIPGFGRHAVSVSLLADRVWDAGTWRAARRRDAKLRRPHARAANGVRAPCVKRRWVWLLAADAACCCGYTSVVLCDCLWPTSFVSMMYGCHSGARGFWARGKSRQMHRAYAPQYQVVQFCLATSARPAARPQWTVSLPRGGRRRGAGQTRTSAMAARRNRSQLCCETAPL